MKTLFLKSGLAIFIFATFLFTIVSCTQTAATPELEPAAVNNITGTVVDQLNVPQANVQIQVGRETTTTSATGTYSINSGGNADGFVYLTAKKSGFIEGSKTFRFTTNTTFNVKIMLVNNTVYTTFNTGIENTVKLPNNTRVKFPRSFVDQNNQPYNGTVSVSMHHIFPSNTDKKYIYRGLAVINNGVVTEKKCRLYGMILIEMKGSAGQLLDISSTSSLQATIVLESSQLTNTPVSLETLDFDDLNGYWRPRGLATIPQTTTGANIDDERGVTMTTRANDYNFARSNRGRGIAFPGPVEEDVDPNFDNGITATKK